MIVPPGTTCPPNALNPRRCAFESRPLRELPKPFLCAIENPPSAVGPQPSAKSMSDVILRRLQPPKDLCISQNKVASTVATTTSSSPRPFSLHSSSEQPPSSWQPASRPWPPP